MPSAIVEILKEISWFISHSFLSQNPIIFILSWGMSSYAMSYCADKYYHLWLVKIVLGIFISFILFLTCYVMFFTIGISITDRFRISLLFPLFKIFGGTMIGGLSYFYFNRKVNG
ncbi:hypothetical protein [Actinobacillus capsulatus]|uniref:hypothetical protein n=1 Tax=Actinobacillus capsulatus TaxID=717 RepID=UPI000372346E|nr:hypothetical protein [Actinobacillus capsulatus]